MSYTALITGASSGIGEATARLLAARDPRAQLILVARRRDRIDALAEQINSAGPAPRAHSYAADLTDPAQVAALAGHVADNFGPLNLLVNNAGARWSGPFSSGGYANVARTMAINFDAQVRLTEVMLPALRAAAALAGPGGAPQAPHGAAEPKAGSPAAAIVNVASTAARVSRPNSGAYSASKAALVGWTDSLYYELKPEGIHVGLVNPGFIATEGFPQAELTSHPVKRLIVSTPEKAAAAVLAAGPGGRAEVFVPGYYKLFAILRIVAPGLLRRSIGGGSFNTSTSADSERV